MTEICTCCGQKIRKLNPHHMDKQKIKVLNDIGRLSRTGKWVKVEHGRVLHCDGKSMDSAYRASEHAARLKWFGLLDYEGNRTGRYRINKNGFAFLKGTHSVSETIYCRDGIVIKKSDEQVHLSDVKGVVFDKLYWDAYWKRQVNREEYQSLFD